MVPHEPLDHAGPPFSSGDGTRNCLALGYGKVPPHRTTLPHVELTATPALATVPNGLLVEDKGPFFTEGHNRVEPANSEEAAHLGIRSQAKLKA
jgi:hypothetical protein